MISQVSHLQQLSGSKGVLYEHIALELKKAVL